LKHKHFQVKIPYQELLQLTHLQDVQLTLYYNKQLFQDFVKECLPATSPPFRSSVYLSVHLLPVWPAAGIPSGIAVGPDGEPFAENH
jgi:hypothetical protein